MNSMKVGIKFKLVSFISTLLLIVIVFLSFFVLASVKNYQNKENQATLLKQKDMFEQYLAENLSSTGNESTEKLQIVRANIFNKPWLRTIPASIYNTSGNLLSGFNTDVKLNENNEKDIMIQYAIKDKMSFKEVNDILYFYSPIKYKNNMVAIIELEYSVKESNKLYNNIKSLFYSAGFLALVIGTILGILYFLNFTKDIDKMKIFVENIQNGEFKIIQEVNRNDELGELSKGLLFMSNTIEKNIKDLKVERDTLTKAVEKLKIMDKQQKEFIGNVTHEFKTPITTIKAYSDTIGMYKEDTILIKEGTQSISRECARLTSMVDRVLSLSALEKYDFEIQISEVNLKALLEQISSSMMGKIRKNNLSLNCNLEDIILLADEESLKHIIINLIDNAIKYNQVLGSISIRCFKNLQGVIIEVSDTGIGIPKETLTKVFEPFYRVESHRSRETGGIGLGLALVKKLVEKQNATIGVHSILGMGTTFSIQFPIIEI
jgi:two-component system phosphate regulon sensor histidine kinase PhoR